MQADRFVFVFKPSNRGISLKTDVAKQLISEGVIEIDKNKKIYKNHGCYFLYAKDPDFNLLRRKYHVIC